MKTYAMPVLWRWLPWGVLRWSALVFLTLAGVVFVFDVIDAIDRFADSRWGVRNTLYYLALLQPGRWYEIAPIAFLIGALAFLGQLARHAELMVLRTSGLSPWQLWRYVATAGLVVAGLTMAVGEWLMPQSEYAARTLSARLRPEGKSPGLWVRDGTNFVNITAVTPDGRLGGVWIYRLDEAHELQAIAAARSGFYDATQKVWILEEVSERRFTPERIELQVEARRRWHSELIPETLQVLWVEPQRMTLAALRTYIDFLRRNLTDASRYEVAWWRKLTLPLAFLTLSALALPFVLRHGRTVALGTQIFAGTMLGVGYYLANQTSAHLGALQLLPPMAVALLPTGVFLVLAALMWRWSERR